MKSSLLAFVMSSLVCTAACNKPAAPTKSPAPATAAAPTVSAEVGDDPAVPRIPVGTKTKCAVSGEEFTVAENTVQVTYKGKRYVFCCADCQPTFAKNPAKFAVN
jgi:YHS domain-containing protein